MPPDQETPDLTPNPETPETGVETPERGGFEVPEAPEAPPARPEEEAGSAAASSPPPDRPAPPPKDPTVRKIESILEEDLGETYAKLPADAKKKFREKGEEVTEEITGMVKSLKIKARKVLSLIRGWLEIIPGINSFFLEQEAKIKTDKVMRLAEEEKGRREGEL